MTQFLSPVVPPTLQPKGPTVGVIQLVAVAAVQASNANAAWLQDPALAPALAHLLASTGQRPSASGPNPRDVNGAGQKAQALQALAAVKGPKEQLRLKRQAQALGLLAPPSRAALVPSPLGRDRSPSKSKASAPVAPHRPPCDDDDVIWTRPIAHALAPKNLRAQLGTLSAGKNADATQARAARTRATQNLLEPSYRRELVGYLNRRGYVLERTDAGVRVRPAQGPAAVEQTLVSAAEMQALATRWGLEGLGNANLSGEKAAEISKPKKFNCYALDNSDHGDALLRLDAHEVRRAREGESREAAKARRRAMAAVLSLSFDPARAEEAESISARTRQYDVLARLGEQTSNSAGARKSSFGLRLVELYSDTAATNRQFREQDDADAKRAIIAYGLDEDRRFDHVAPRTMLQFAEPAWNRTLAGNARAKAAKAYNQG